MVEAPEKIWAQKTPSQFFATDIEISNWTEYTRADIAERQIAELRAKLDEYKEVAHNRTAAWTAAEAENARLRALPLEDEVERVLENGRKNTVAVMKALMATGGRDNLLLADAVHRADDAARVLLQRLATTKE